jgi:hypothetical protein
MSFLVGVAWLFDSDKPEDFAPVLGVFWMSSATKFPCWKNHKVLPGFVATGCGTSWTACSDSGLGAAEFFELGEVNHLWRAWRVILQFSGNGILLVSSD